MHFVEAQEPTNIIWENRHLTKAQRLQRSFKAWVIIIILVFLSFTLIYYIQYFALKLTNKYPEADCGAIKNSYGDEFYYYAYQEYVDYADPEQEYFLTGSLQCYCYQ
mmetsp:Transcript_21614/g.20740  ORF Transcript_21614/g.20740 Transcript_21614/m.20740 type:complete len:107 (+) Transcript_21614:1495-1815(+)